MTILTIPVTPFTRRIIEATHEKMQSPLADEAIIQLRDRDTLYLHLCNRRSRERLNQQLLDGLLTDSVTLALSDVMATHISKNERHLGYYLNQIHRSALDELIWWETQVLHSNDNCELEAKAVIESFCTRHNIELDIHINYDTLYKSWTRHKARMRRMTEKDKKNVPIFGKNDRQTVRRFSRKSARRIQRKNGLLIPAEVLDATIMSYFTIHENTYFATRRKKPRVWRCTQLKLYVWHVLGGRPMKLVAERFGIKLNKAYDHVTSFELFLRHAPAVVLETAVDHVSTTAKTHA